MTDNQPGSSGPPLGTTPQKYLAARILFVNFRADRAGKYEEVANMNLHNTLITLLSFLQNLFTRKDVSLDKEGTPLLRSFWRCCSPYCAKRWIGKFRCSYRVK
jgi:hypothetical protein